MPRSAKWYAEDVPAGTHKVIFYLDGDYPGEYDTTCLISPFKDGALVHGLHGTFNRKVLNAMFEYGREHGYKVAYFARSHGVTFRRFASHVCRVDGFDYYRLEL